MFRRLIHLRALSLPPPALSVLTSQLGLLLPLLGFQTVRARLGDHLRVGRPLLGSLALCLCMRWLSRLVADLRPAPGFSHSLPPPRTFLYCHRLAMPSPTTSSVLFPLPTVLVTRGDLFSYPFAHATSYLHGVSGRDVGSDLATPKLRCITKALQFTHISGGFSITNSSGTPVMTSATRTRCSAISVEDGSPKMAGSPRSE